MNGKQMGLGIAILFAGVVLAAAQIVVEWVRPTLAFNAYFDCVRKVATYDWSKVPGGQPGSASEICKRL